MAEAGITLFDRLASLPLDKQRVAEQVERVANLKTAIVAFAADLRGHRIIPACCCNWARWSITTIKPFRLIKTFGECLIDFAIFGLRPNRWRISRYLRHLRVKDLSPRSRRLSDVSLRVSIQIFPQLLLKSIC